MRSSVGATDSVNENERYRYRKEVKKKRGAGIPGITHATFKLSQLRHSKWPALSLKSGEPTPTHVDSARSNQK